jgi:phosphoserine phosphatase
MKLKIFDFDGTLMNTPTKPFGWKGGWWGKGISLVPPHVPHHSKLNEEGQHLLNQKVVDEYRAAKKCKNTHTVMMTGRHWGIRREVMNILKAFELATEDDHNSLHEEHDHFVFISGGNTLAGKIERINMFMKKYEFDEIEMWEDRVEHIAHFRAHGDVLKKQYPNFKGITVHEPPDWS